MTMLTLDIVAYRKLVHDVFHVEIHSYSWCEQYWVVYSFLTVFESAVNAVYWFR